VTAIRAGEELDTALRRADAAMYAAKQAGRDRTVVGAAG
jgi:PleD family two-component response regulator